MKKIFMTAAACLLTLMITMLSPLQALAAAGAGTEKYIGEVKIGMGKDAAQAAGSLKGYKILSDKSGYIDLNQKAGGGWGSKGEKVVYLGYKTTNDSADAITDLAVMNMENDSYNVVEYDALFDAYIEGQIEPMVDRFTDALKEYRYNFSYGNESNRHRAVYIHDALNKLIDDDTGKGLGDLLLNRTKYEIGDDAYNALSETQKNNTADIVTIIAQSNGKATLLLENLLARAADTSDDTWIDRFAATTYDDLIDGICDDKGILPSDAVNEAARLYEDDARKLMSMWYDFSGRLSGYDQALELIESFDVQAAEQKAAELEEFIRGFDPEKNTDEELAKAVAEQYELLAAIAEMQNAVKTVAVYEYLDQYEYAGGALKNGTMADFFSMKAKDVPLTELYPLAASFSDGQRAGLEFVSMSELVTIAMTDGESYRDAELDDLWETSIFEGVDRGIYKRGGVALIKGVSLEKAMEQSSEERLFSNMTYIMFGVTSVSFISMCTTATMYLRDLRRYASAVKSVNQKIATTQETMNMLEGQFGKDSAGYQQALYEKGQYETELKAITPPSGTCKYLSIGLGVAVVVLIAITTYMAYEDLKEHYNVEFSPIPHYMVDEKDITAYNEKGEKIFIKNQTAYYKAVECNRTSDDEMYGTLGVCSDLNGDVGKQWLALYAVKNEAMAPILADSLKAVADDDRLPANYTTGIHMFGSDTAFNLNNHSYVWEGEAPSVYVYFNTDSSAKRSAVGSIFVDSGSALAGGIGIIIGALAVCALMLPARKKKEDETAATM